MMCVFGSSGVRFSEEMTVFLPAAFMQVGLLGHDAVSIRALYDRLGIPRVLLAAS